jgi:hypothetical protein
MPFKINKMGNIEFFADDDVLLDQQNQSHADAFDFQHLQQSPAAIQTATSNIQTATSDDAAAPVIEVGAMPTAEPLPPPPTHFHYATAGQDFMVGTPGEVDYFVFKADAIHLGSDWRGDWSIADHIEGFETGIDKIITPNWIDSGSMSHFDNPNGDHGTLFIDFMWTNPYMGSWLSPVGGGNAIVLDNLPVGPAGPGSVWFGPQAPQFEYSDIARFDDKTDALDALVTDPPPPSPPPYWEPTVPDTPPEFHYATAGQDFMVGTAGVIDYFVFNSSTLHTSQESNWPNIDWANADHIDGFETGIDKIITPIWPSWSNFLSIDESGFDYTMIGDLGTLSLFFGGMGGTNALVLDNIPIRAGVNRAEPSTALAPAFLTSDISAFDYKSYPNPLDADVMNPPPHHDLFLV